ncbi:SDR family NAD(P)-dependent oxidoreductase, partial [Micromonospora sp. DT233]|uniref:beta-ketoacyl reductase n=1 Tax=Micromonospora sp. DT233 TaxID=3393432 RepID=UPI003CF85D5A
LRQPVRFHDVTKALVEEGHTAFIECSAHPVLTPAIQEDLPALGTLRRDGDDVAQWLTARAEAFVVGLPVTWPVTVGGDVTALPTYPFQRERYWLEGRPARPAETRRSELDDWSYGIAWRPLPEPEPARPSGTRLLVVPADADGLGWVAALDGADVRRLVVGPDDDRATLAARLRDTGPVDGVISLLALGHGRLADEPRVSYTTGATLRLVQALGDAAVDAPLWCLTSGAVRVDDGADPADPVQAEIWGLGRVVALEHPRRWGGLIDLPASPDERNVRRVHTVLAGGTGEDQVAVRAAAVLARRLVPRRLATGPTWTPRGTVLVTGGTGAAGAHVARWLAGAGAARLVLTSRRGPDAEGAAELVEELGRLGVPARAVACDVSDPAAVADLITAIDADGEPLRAVVHAAGLSTAAPVAETTVADLAELLAAKAGGAHHLIAALGDRPLDAFVLFSSGAAVWGGGGQGAYAAANAHLDALAGASRTSVAWGMWGGGGMASGAVGDRMTGLGLRPMAPEEAAATLGRLVGGANAAPVVADIDWKAFAPQFTAMRPSPLLAELPAAREALAEPETPKTAPTDLGGRTEPERFAAVLSRVRAEAAAVLGHGSAEAVPADRAFKDMGVDSLTAVQLRNRLNTVTGLRLPSTVVFDYPNPTVLARFVLAELSGAPAQVDQAVQPSTPADEPIAIVGMGCRFPGGVRSPEGLWDLVVAG